MREPRIALRSIRATDSAHPGGCLVQSVHDQLAPGRAVSKRLMFARKIRKPWSGRQGARDAAAFGAVDFAHLSEENSPRCAVANNMMGGEQEHMRIRLQADQATTHQWPLREIHGDSRFFLQHGLKLLLLLCFGRCGEIDQRPRSAFPPHPTVFHLPRIGRAWLEAQNRLSFPGCDLPGPKARDPPRLAARSKGNAP